MISPTILGSLLWISTGVNNADNVPVAVTGDILYFGIPGYGVARKDLATLQLDDALTTSETILTRLLHKYT